MKFLVVGLGSMGKRRIRNLQHLGIKEICGCDLKPDRRAEATAKYRVPTFADFGSALDSFQPDAVVISTPPDLHGPFALAAAGSGRHFFMEVGVELQERADLLAVAAANHVVAAPSCTMRFHPSIRRIKDLLDDGDLNPILNFTYHSGQYLPDWHPWEDYRTFYVSRKHTGACREIVVFELIWLTWLFGGVSALTCFRDKLTELDTDIDDAYHLLLRFASGQVGTVVVDAISRVPRRQLTLQSEQGVVDWNYTGRVLRVYRPGTDWQEYPEPAAIQEAGYVSSENMYIGEMQAFVDAIQGVRPWPLSLEEDGRVVDLLRAAERSSDAGETIRLSGG